MLKARDLLQSGWRPLRENWTNLLRPNPAPLYLTTQAACCNRLSISTATPAGPQGAGLLQIAVPAAQGVASAALAKPAVALEPFWSRLWRETSKAVLLVVQFMTLAYFLEALIQLYIPEAWVAGLVGHQSTYTVLTAALLGVPVYTSNLTALPMISGLLAHGMSPAAALAFLIAGPTTTLPAMSAVWGLVSRRVFALYVAFSLLGAILFGYLYQIFLNS